MPLRFSQFFQAQGVFLAKKSCVLFQVIFLMMTYKQIYSVNLCVLWIISMRSPPHIIIRFKYDELLNSFSYFVQQVGYQPVGNMPCWFYEKPDLTNTPSFKDGIDASTEARYRREAARFIIDAGTSQGLYPFQLTFVACRIFVPGYYLL